MLRKAISMIRSLLIVVCVTAVLSSSAKAGTCVSKFQPGCYTTIQQAVNAASPSAVIRIFPGTYAEMVTITKPLTLTGLSPTGVGTNVDATGLAHAIYITGVSSGKVVITKLTLENANREGIIVENSRNVSIIGNTVIDNDRSLDTSNLTCPGAFPFMQEDCGEGVHLMGTSNSIVSGNIVTKNAGGILLSDETDATHDNQILNNKVTGNPYDCGITLASHPPCKAGSSDAIGCIGGPQIGTPSPGVYGNLVESNYSSENGAAGIGAYTPTPGTSSHDNTISRNTVIGNGQGGVLLHSHAPGQDLNGNVIENNQIRDNAGDPDSEGTNPPNVGIVVFSDASAGAAPLSGIVVRNNTIRNEDVDLFVGTAAINLGPSHNNLYPSGKSAVGIDNAGTGTIDAAENYWGCPFGPGVAGCSTVEGNSVSTSPVLPLPYFGL